VDVEVVAAVQSELSADSSVAGLGGNSDVAAVNSGVTSRELDGAGWLVASVTGDNVDVAARAVNDGGCRQGNVAGLRPASEGAPCTRANQHRTAAGLTVAGLQRDVRARSAVAALRGGVPAQDGDVACIAASSVTGS
jgi:hypothetical protein